MLTIRTVSEGPDRSNALAAFSPQEKKSIRFPPHSPNSDPLIKIEQFLASKLLQHRREGLGFQKDDVYPVEHVP